MCYAARCVQHIVRLHKTVYHRYDCLAVAKPNQPFLRLIELKLALYFFEVFIWYAYQQKARKITLLDLQR